MSQVTSAGWSTGHRAVVNKINVTGQNKIIHELGQGDKGNENQPRLKNFNMNLILTCLYYKQY